MPVLVVVVLVGVVDVVLVAVVSADAPPPPQDASTRLVTRNSALQIEVFMESLLSVGVKSSFQPKK